MKETSTTTAAGYYGSSLVVSAATFSATVLLTTVWKKRRSRTITTSTTASATSILTSNKNKISSRRNFRLVRYLSEQHSSWSDYGDDDEGFIRDLPKIELHVHLDGSFDGHFLWNYMKEHPESLYCLPVTTTPPWDPAKPLPVRSMVQQCQTDKDFHNLCTCRGHRSLKAMLNCFEIFLPLVRGNLELIEHLAYDFCQRQWEQNVVYTEVRYSPHLLAEGFSPDNSEEDGTTTTRVTAQAVLESVTRGLRRGCRDFPDLTVTQILCSIAWRPDWALATVDLAERYRDAQPCPVVGVDVAAGEEMFDAAQHPDLYRPHYAMAQRARELGIPLTLHAGESTEHALENVRRAVLEYGAVRIGHGYRMVDSAAIMQLVRDHNVHVEVCPTSSVETGGWVYDDGNGDDDDEEEDDGRGRNWKRHPAVTMLQHGVSISLSSDDPAVFHTSLAWQYRIALAKMELTPRDLVCMNLDAVDAAWCSEAEKERLRRLIRCFAKGKQIEGLDLTNHPCGNVEKSRTDSFSDRVYLNAHEYT